MENIYIGDVHGRKTWKDVLDKNPEADNYVFIGDYLDSYYIQPLEQLENLIEIVEFKKNPLVYLVGKRKKTTVPKVHLLIGNHDIHYWSGILLRGETSGYQTKMFPVYNQIFEEDKKEFQISCTIGDKLCSHAGISPEFLELNSYDYKEDVSDFLNELFYHKPNNFEFANQNTPVGSYLNPYGDDTFQSPVWIRPKSLQRSNKKNKFIKEKYTQIVGHTTQDYLNLSGKTTGGKYIYIDTLGVGEYLIEEDGVLKVGKL